jgi:hypothetical protein
MKQRMEESRQRAAEHRVEDVEFRERLVKELQRHNRLMETLIARR